jgi:hypothetical protein
MVLIKTYSARLATLSICAGILYNSWPLGHWLNPSVSKNSLASGLEAIGQPYNWVFIGGDITSSILVILLCWLLWRRFGIKKSERFMRISLIFIVLFGVGTIIDALLPERCVPGVQVCASFTQDHLLLYHGIFSIAASLFLFLSLCVLWFRQRKNKLINGLLAGYIVFGLMSLFQAVTPGKNGNWSQDYYITLCSVWLALMPYVIYMSLQYVVASGI